MQVLEYGDVAVLDAATTGVAAEIGSQLLSGLLDAGSGLAGRAVPRLLDETGTVRPPVKTPWGWTGSGSYRAAVAAVDRGDTLETVGGVVPTQAEAEMLIEDAGGVVNRVDDAHLPPNPHQYPHINYTTSAGLRGTIRIDG